MSRKLIPETPQSILLVRLTARGDVVFASPLIRALRRTYPHARLSWLGEAHTTDLVENHPELHRIFSWNRKRWKTLLKKGRFLTLVREARELVGGLRREDFDVVLDLQGALRSGVMSFLTGAGTRIVLRPREGSHLFATRVVDRQRDQGNRWEISSEYRHLARELELDSQGFLMEVALSEHDRDFANRAIQEHRLENGFAVAIPFTTRPQKHWFENRWALLAGRMKEEYGLSTVFLGGPGDREAQERIRSQVGPDAVGLVGGTSLTEAAALIERAALVVGVDTGLTHMGLAFQRPTIGIFGSNIPYTKTFSDRTRVLIHWLECVPCKGHPTCDGDFTCLRLITVDEVMEAANQILDRG